MTKRMIKMLIIVGILFGGIFGFKAFRAYSIKKHMNEQKEAAITVSAIKVTSQNWKPKLKTLASFSAVNGVDVTTELAGLITSVPVSSGGYVKKGDILVQLNAEADIALLHSLEANAELAKITYERDKGQFAAKAISKATLDADAANLKSTRAQVDEQAATVAKKTIRAPFSGRFGILAINVGQYLNVGDPIAPLQTLDPIFAQLYMPQEVLAQVFTGQPIQITTGTFPNEIFEGKITTINPKVDPATRNVQIEATVANPKEILLPGMFATAEIHTGAPHRRLTLPQTAVSFNPYGEIAFIIKEKGKDNKGNPILIAYQTFITTGEKRGDQVAILKGLEEGDLVVTAGQLKLKNGSPVTINNAVVPSNDPAPKPIDQ